MNLGWLMQNFLYMRDIFEFSYFQDRDILLSNQQALKYLKSIRHRRSISDLDNECCYEICSHEERREHRAIGNYVNDKLRFVISSVVVKPNLFRERFLWPITIYNYRFLKVEFSNFRPRQTSSNIFLKSSKTIAKIQKHVVEIFQRRSLTLLSFEKLLFIL